MRDSNRVDTSNISDDSNSKLAQTMAPPSLAPDAVTQSILDALAQLPDSERQRILDALQAPGDARRGPTP
jgi:hypothetical protein